MKEHVLIKMSERQALSLVLGAAREFVAHWETDHDLSGEDEKKIVALWQAIFTLERDRNENP